MLTVQQATAAQPQPVTTGEEQVQQDFLKAMTMLNKEDLKKPYVLKEFAGEIVFNDNDSGHEFTIDGKKFSDAEMAEKAEKLGERLLPSLAGKYEPDQSPVYITAAPLDGKTYKYEPRKNINGEIFHFRNGKMILDKKYDVSALEIGAALLALSVKRTEFTYEEVIKNNFKIPMFRGFKSDGVIDAEEIGAAGKGDWVALMKRLYALFSKAKKTSAVLS